MLPARTEPKTRTATLRITGDIAIPTAQAVYGQLRGLARRRDVRTVVLDLAEAGRIDSAGLAVVSLGGRLIARAGKTFDIAHASDVQRAALDLIPSAEAAAPPADDRPRWLERVGARTLELFAACRAALALVADTCRQLGLVIARRKRLPRGALLEQAGTMGVDAVGIVGMLGMLLGTTLAFQAVVLLQRFGAGVFSADMIGVSMVREFGPMMTAIILTGRTGAAIAAELGTMRVRSELDALDAMGISATRFLLLPRLLALTIVQPCLTLMATFLGIAGGMLVCVATLHFPPGAFWDRVVDRVALSDFVHGFIKSVIFAWIIGFTGCHFGLRASGDASSVGAATTRAVVVGVFLVILVDAIAATIVAAT